MLHKLAIGSSMLALVPSVKASSPIPSEPQRPPPMKLEDLPVYEAPHANYNEHIAEQNKSTKFIYVQSALEGPVKTLREQVQNVLQQTSTVTNAFSDNYHEIVDRSDWIVKYLREEENRDQRYGAVAIGGLTGFIFGLRGGFIRRLFYAGIGTSAMGAVCFPEETKQVYRSNGALLRTYVNIAYNFLYGVKPGDPQLEVKFPELSLPKDFSQFVDLTTSLASSVKQAVMPPPAKDAGDSKPSDKKE